MTIKIKINDVEVTAQEGKSLLDAAKDAGFEIPHLCHHPAVEASGSCRICLVELKANGKEELTTSCNVQVEDGMEVLTDSSVVRKHRAMNLELLLARAPGATQLRQLAFEYGVKLPRFAPAAKKGLPNCILCDLCVRVCARLDHYALATTGRGDKKQIGLPFGKPAEACVGCGSCVSVCPTGCIPMNDTATTRTIWGQNHNFILCEKCHAPVITEKHREHAINTKGLSEDYYNVCESCKQATTSKRFASVVW
jgi:NADH dehydrogenase/NADH:ubiquinone oxidoreductase subunit G